LIQNPRPGGPKRRKNTTVELETSGRFGSIRPKSIRLGPGKGGDASVYPRRGSDKFRSAPFCSTAAGPQRSRLVNELVVLQDGGNQECVNHDRGLRPTCWPRGMPGSPVNRQHGAVIGNQVFYDDVTRRAKQFLLSLKTTRSARIETSSWRSRLSWNLA